MNKEIHTDTGDGYECGKFNKKPRPKKLDKAKIYLINFQTMELMEHSDGYSYERNCCINEAIGSIIEWYPEGCSGISEDEIRDHFADELEKAYQLSKQGFEFLYLKKKRK